MSNKTHSNYGRGTLKAAKKFVVERRPLGSLPPLLAQRKFSLKTGAVCVGGEGQPRATPERVLEYLRWYCEQGARAPSQSEMARDLGHQARPLVTLLALQGKMIVEVGGRNWRVIEIDGKRTQADPNGSPPNRRISKRGHERCVNGKWVPIYSADAWLKDVAG